jgi:hypothetical protein
VVLVSEIYIAGHDRSIEKTVRIRTIDTRREEENDLPFANNLSR